jgi:hypothetical protein
MAEDSHGKNLRNVCSLSIGTIKAIVLKEVGLGGHVECMGGGYAIRLLARKLKRGTLWRPGVGTRTI